MNKTKRIDEWLADVRSVGIAGHVRPDGDCVGATLALYNYIKEYYPQIDVKLYLEPIPNIFRFLSRAEDIQTECTQELVFDLFFALDCGDLGRLGDAARYFEGAVRTACIDHHVSNRRFADINYIFPDASSTSELIFELLDEARITEKIAECLYTGIVHDTGMFQYSCTSARTMNIAGILMEKGIDYPRIATDTFYARTYNQNRILGKALVDSKLYLDGRCIVSVVTGSTMREFNVLPKHMEGVVSQLRVTKGVEVAMLLYENPDGTYKGSLRASNDLNVAEIAMLFGGGGHVKAAGFTITDCLEENIEKLLCEIAERLQDQND